MKSILIMIFACMFLFAGCYSYGTKQSVIQKESSSSIRLVGKAKGTQVQIDENNRVEITDTDSDDFNSWNPRHLYRVSPGKHRVRIYRDNTLIVDQLFFVGSDEIKEVSIP